MNISTTTTNKKASTSLPPSLSEIIRHIIQEGGQIYEQVDSYDNTTGEVIITVPPHGDRDAVQIFLSPNTVSI